MATIIVPGGSPVVIKGDNLYVFGDSSDEGANGGWLIHIVDDNSVSMSATVQAQSLLLTRSAGVTASFETVPYRGGVINGSAADWSFDDTALTTDSIIFVPAGGMTIGLLVDWTSGSATIYALPVIGACSF